MKNALKLLIAGCAFALAAFAQSPTESLVRIQAETKTGDVQAFFEKSITVNGTTYALPGWESVSWNSGSKTVTVGGETKTYTQVMAFVVAIAQQERAEQVAAQAAQQGGTAALPSGVRPNADGVNWDYLDREGNIVATTLAYVKPRRMIVVPAELLVQNNNGS